MSTRAASATQRKRNSLQNLRQNLSKKLKKHEVSTQQSPSTPPRTPRIKDVELKRRVWSTRLKTKSVFKRQAAAAAADEEWKPPVSQQQVHTESPTTRNIHITKQMSHSDLLNMQCDANLTGRQMKIVMAAIRKGTQCRTIFQPNFITASQQLNTIFADLFAIREFTDEKEGNTVPAFFATNVTALFERLEKLHARKIGRIHLGGDYGKRFLKVALTIEWKRDELNVDKDAPADDVPDHSQRRAILLANIPNVHESHASIHKLFHILNFPTATHPFVFIGDMKFLGLTLGIAGGSASFGCVFCEQDLRVSAPRELQLSAAKLRTPASISQHFHELKESGDLDNHKNYYSCVAEPMDLYSENKNDNISDIIAIPGLHCLLSGNWFIDRLAKQGDNIAAAVDTWYTGYHMVRPTYHSGDFEGNQLRRLLRPDSLKRLFSLLQQADPKGASIRITRHTAYDAVPQWRRLYDGLVSFALVVHNVFGKKLRGLWRDSIANFRKTLLRIDVKRYPVKFHVLTAHLEDWCLKHKRGLANVSEQWVEATHHEFIRLWDNCYKVNDTSQPAFAKNLLRCSLAMNSRHIPLPSPELFLDVGRGSTIASTGASHIWEGPTLRVSATRV